MTEPDAPIFKPLNLKADEMRGRNGNEDEEEEEPEPSNSAENGKKFENFVEDPSVVRARLERKREEKYQHRKGYQPQQPKVERDVVGKLGLCVYM
jgi:hypothetical protein